MHTETITWHEIPGPELPDSDLTVLVRMRNNEEPVWLGFLDGEQWRDLDGMLVDVVHWADIPKGGDA